jgi:hypothetical protein
VHNPYFANHYIYLNDVHLRCRNFMIPTCIYIYPWVLLVQDRIAALLRLNGSMSNMSLLTIGGYYYYFYIHDKMLETKWWPGRDMVWVLVGVTSCVPQPRGIAGLHCFPIHVN